MIEIIEKIKEKLKKYPHVKFEEREGSITVLPFSDDGFEVALYVGKQDAYEVHFNGWHENFSSDSEAFDCFAFGLSEECRLKEYSRGSLPYRWTVEFYRDEEWQEDSTTSLVFFPFWNAKVVRFLQNHLISR